MPLGIGIGLSPLVRHGATLKQNEAETTVLLARMDALGELPSLAQQTNINDTIKALKAACLFDRRFDALWVMRGYGLGATKLNWIKDAHNLTKMGAGTLTYSDGVGYKSDASSTCLDTNYIPATDGIIHTQDDACMFIKLGGTVTGTNRTAMGAITSSGVTTVTTFFTGAGGGQNTINASMRTADASAFAAGYNCMSRIKNTEHLEYINAALATKLSASNAYLPNQSIYILANHDRLTNPRFYMPNTAIAEIAGIGGHISQDEFNTLQSIFNTYISKL